MGRSKSDLPFGGSTFLEIVTATAAAVFDEVILVQRPGGTDATGFRTLTDAPHDDAAAVFGVMQALSDAAGKCFVIAVDYPLITSDVLSYLRESFEKTYAPMLVPVWGDKPQMLCAGYSASLVRLLQSRVANGQLNLRGLIEEAGAEMIGEAVLRKRFSGEPLMNVNTPAELEEARVRYGG